MSERARVKEREREGENDRVKWSVGGRMECYCRCFVLRRRRSECVYASACIVSVGGVRAW